MKLVILWVPEKEPQEHLCYACSNGVGCCCYYCPDCDKFGPYADDPCAYCDVCNSSCWGDHEFCHECGREVNPYKHFGEWNGSAYHLSEYALETLSRGEIPAPMQVG